MTRRDWWIFGVVALVGAFLMTRGMFEQPGGFTDVFYHYNAANRLVNGEGFTDPYLWVYVGMPDGLPAPSHLYWMPLTSLLAAVGMWLLNAPGSYAAAQWPFALMLAGAALTAFYLGSRFGKSRRHAWFAGLITLFGGYYLRFWGATDTFAPYAFIGSFCLVTMGFAVTTEARRAYPWAAACGALAALGHLTRADGVLLLMVGVVVVLWPAKRLLRSRIALAGVMVVAYLVVMSPWFMRNLDVVGSPLPIGGAQGIWFTEYNDLFSYPPDANPQTFFASGQVFASRWEAFVNNLGTFVAVEGMIVLTPLMLIGLWTRRRNVFLRGFWLYALGVHVAMTIIFPFPGYRGGLLHSAVALLPWWAALGVVGLDDVVDWIAKRRRAWNPGVAKSIFSLALMVFVVFLSLSIALPRRVKAQVPALYQALDQVLPDQSRVMINDPMQLYYYTGHGGVVLPNEVASVIPQIAAKYDVDYLLLEVIQRGEEKAVAAPASLVSIVDAPPDFLIPLDVDLPGAILYEIHY
ncbi:MAG: hypothetical protein K8L99_00400 [Anaerolineae bacterium]|nr:hypothetical protein [Anaerolineae bacterium]